MNDSAGLFTTATTCRRLSETRSHIAVRSRRRPAKKRQGETGLLCRFPLEALRFLTGSEREFQRPLQLAGRIGVQNLPKIRAVHRGIRRGKARVVEDVERLDS